MTEDGRVEIVDIRFGNTIYRNVSVDRLKPIDEASHSHPRSGKELDDKKKKRNKMTKEIAEQKLNLFLEKNVPTNPAKWSYYKSQAKKSLMYTHLLTPTHGQLNNTKPLVVVGKRVNNETS